MIVTGHKIIKRGGNKKIKYLEVKPKYACLSILTSVMVGNFFSYVFVVMSALNFYKWIRIWIAQSEFWFVLLFIVNILECIDSKTLTWQILKMTYTWNPIHAWKIFQLIKILGFYVSHVTTSISHPPRP